MQEFLANLDPKLVTSILVILISCVLLLVLSRAYKRLSKSQVEYFSDENYRHTARNIYNVVRSVLIVVAVLVVLDVNDINIGTLATGFGIAGVVVAFAVQDALSDLVTGARIISDDYFKAGDVVRLNGIEGEVLRIRPQSTKIKSIVDGSIITISNRQITSAEVVSKMNDINLPLRYELSLSQVDDLCSEIVRRLKLIDGIDDASFEGTSSFEDSAVNYRIRFFCTPDKRLPLHRACLRAIQEVLEEKGLDIPYNQLEILNK